MHEHHKEIAVLYHGGCPDGFGGAYAAWKKFGDTADYIPVKHGQPVPAGLAGRRLIIIDFSYPQDIMNELVKTSVSVTVLDHHLGAKDIVESMSEHVFDEKRSGATIAWSYFHPGVPIPTFLTHVEDSDLYLFKLPDTRAVISYVYAHPFTFDAWDQFVKEVEDSSTRAELLKKGTIFAEHFALLVEQIANKAVLVSFEGYECYLATAADMFKSDVGNLLARRKPPLSLIVSFRGDVLNVSLRSDDSIDVSMIAKKYGGSGHPHASAFRLNWGDSLPWTVIGEHENPRS